MPVLDSLIVPITRIIDKVIPDKEARERAKLELLTLEGTHEMQMVEAAFPPSSQRPIPPIRGPAGRAPVFST